MSRPRSQTGALAVVVLACGGVVMHLLGAETPHGRVTGTLVTAERGTLLTGVRVSLVSTRHAGQAYRTTTDGRGRFAFEHVPVGTYSLAAKTHAHEQPSGVIAVKETETFSALFELEPTDPFLHTLLSQTVFATDEGVQVGCHGFVPANELAVSAYQIAPDVAVRKWTGPLSEGLTTHGQGIYRANLDSVPELSPAINKRVEIRSRDLEGVFRQDVSLGKLPPGMYLIAIEAEGLRELRAVAVTDLGLVVKASPGQVVVFAANIESGKPLGGVSVEVLREGTALAGGETDGSGLLTLSLPPDQGEGELHVVGHYGESLAVAEWYSYWEREAGPLRVYTYTDRPVYRPGHRVHFKTLVRKLEGDEYEVPEPTQARVKVVDDSDNLLYSAQHTTNEYGSLYGEFDLPQSALPGACSLQVLIGGEVQRSYFMVAEYRKPEFEAEITTDRERHTRGETIEAVVQAEYYYGAPVPDASVYYYVTRAAHWYTPARDEWDADLYEGYEEPEGEVITSGEASTDGNGRLRITVPTGLEGDETPENGQDYRYTFHAEVTDASRRSASGSHGVLVTQGAFRLEVSPEDWAVEPGQQTAVTIRAIDYDDRPVPGVRGELVIGQAAWDDDHERLTEEARQQWVTDEEGEARLTVTPRSSGDYRLRAKAADASGNTIKRAASLWVMSRAYPSFDYPYQDLDVRADRDLYEEGEVAEIVVRTRYAPRTALLTIESGGILEQRLVQLKDKASVLKVKVRHEFVPSAHAKVCFVMGKQFFAGDAIVHVSRETKALHVEVASDKPQYEPGEKAVYRVRTTTADGKPARAEVSLGLADEAIYKIEPDRTPDILQYFYPKRPAEVRTVFSFPEVYLDGDNKAGSQIRTRRIFLDTAFWQPATLTDAKGEATFEVSLPDNLTTWRATCRAATVDTHVGQATYQAAVSKPFSVRLQAPRFFTQGDRVQLAAIVHNLTPNAVSAAAGLEADGLKLMDRPQTECHVGPGQTRRLEWEVQVTGVRECRARVWAKAGSIDDAMELTLPIAPKGRERRAARSGAATSDADLRFEVREDCIPGTQRLAVRLTPSVGAAMLGALEYLATYPYGCVEQTMSSFLPDVVIMRMLRELGVRNPGLEEELPKMVEAGLLRLYDFERHEGGWGWWKYDKPDPWMTSYVVFGLLQAKAAGFTVNEAVLGRALSAVAEMAADPEAGDADTRAYMAYVLALAGRKQLASQTAERLAGFRRWGPPANLSGWGKAMLALALGKTGNGDSGRALLGQVWRTFEGSGSFQAGHGRWCSEVETAAALLSAACELTPDDPRLPDLVRWMLERRRANRWYSTRDTAMALYALCDYLRVGSELQPEMRATVRVNGRVVVTRRFTAADVFQPEHEIVLEPSGIPSGPLAVKIEKVGKGRLYYTAALDQVVATDLSAPVRSAAGIRVARSYRKLDRKAQSKPASEPERETVTRYIFASGDVIEATLTVRCEREFEHIMVEDMLPAGCEAQDRGRIDPWEWRDWWADRVVRDEKVAFAVTHLRRGVNRVRYQMSAQIPGEYTALPPRAYDMYDPAVYTEGVAHTVIVRP